MVKSVAISLAFTSVCKQKKDHIMHHVKFAAIHWNFTSTISYTIYIDYLTIIYVSGPAIINHVSIDYTELYFC